MSKAMEAMVEQITEENFQTLVVDGWLKRREVRVKVIGEGVLRFEDLRGVPCAECYVGIADRDDAYYIIH